MLYPRLLLTLLCASLSAFAHPRCRLDVAIEPQARTVQGRIAIDLTNTSRTSLAALQLWRFPARLHAPSPALNDYNFYWVFPRSFSPATMVITELTVEGVATQPQFLDAAPAGPGTVISVPLRVPLAPGARTHVEVAFTTTVPKRHGAFGCSEGSCRLAGGFYPMPVALSETGYDATAPPAPCEYQASVRAPGEVVVAGQGTSPYLTLLIDRGLGERTLEHRGVRLRYLSHAPPSPPPLPPGKAAPYLNEDRAELVLQAGREAIELLFELGLPLDAGEEIRMAEAPLRLELAEAHPGMVLVSDQIYRILPAERFRKFHSFQLVRALFGLLLERRLLAHEQPEDLAWSPDVAASWLTDRFILREYQRSEFARDILHWVSFVPTIDRILYAPQVPFATAYFNTLDEADPTRDSVRRFSHRSPRGKTIYEKLRDRLGDAATERVVRAQWRGSPIRGAAEEQAHAPLGEFFAQWLGPYPEVDYRFELISREPIRVCPQSPDRVGRGSQPGSRGATRAPTGGRQPRSDKASRGENEPDDGRTLRTDPWTGRPVQGANWRYRIRLYKQGPHPPVEPVELRVTEWGGERHDLTWDGVGRETVLTVETNRAIQSVEIDPRGRLYQRLADSNDNLRLNDRSPARLKFIYNNFGGLLDLQAMTLDLSLDFTLARIYDVKDSFRFTLYRSKAAQIGASTSYHRGFGRLITPARLSSGFSLSLLASRLEPSFGRMGELPQPGTRITLGAGIGYDDRLYIWEPRRATAYGASLSYSLTVLDTSRTLQQFTIGASAQRIQPLADGHGLAGELGVAATFGDLELPTQMLSIGAPGWLRGYPSDELIGRLRLAGKVEYRHVFLHDLNVNLLHALYLRGISGALFTEAGAISPCGGYAIGSEDLFADVGYSLRFIEEWFGVSQTLFNIDFAVPLVRRARSCFQGPGAAPIDPAKRPPFGLFVYFGPVW